MFIFLLDVYNYFALLIIHSVIPLDLLVYTKILIVLFQSPVLVFELLFP